jgi:transcriptional regulator with XRE-family HTH domain
MNYKPNPHSLVSARESRALSIEEVADLAQISTERLRALEAGELAKAGELNKLARLAAADASPGERSHAERRFSSTVGHAVSA